MKANPIVFIDRDGTLIEEGDYLRDPEKIRFLPGVFESLRRLNKAGFLTVVVSNQSGVGRGLMTVEEQSAVAKRFESLLKANRAEVHGSFYCLHAPGDRRCRCRKPLPGLMKQAGLALGVAWKGGISIGDRPSDVQLAQKAGGVGLLVKTGYGGEWAKIPKKVGANAILSDFNSAVHWILKNVERDESYGRPKNSGAGNRRTGGAARGDSRRAVARGRQSAGS